MAVIDYSELEAKSGKVGDDEIQRFRETIATAPLHGAIEGEAAYFVATDDPARVFRIGSWPSFDDFVAAFHEWLVEEEDEEEAQKWAEAFDNHKATAYHAAYSTLPLTAPVLGLAWFYLFTEETAELQRYLDKLKGEIDAITGISCSAVWNADPQHEKTEVMMVCGWKSAEQHKKFFNSSFMAKAKESVSNLHNFEEAASWRVEIPDLPEETA